MRSAVKVAIALQQPLLITGDPGTGKTQLANKVAMDLSENNPDFLSKPFVFNTKTNSVATDLFYTYDAIKHFHDANIRNIETDPLQPTYEYINLQALGKAIALTQKEEIETGEYIGNEYTSPKGSVVLIDEIDKAPRDFPNDILTEIENYHFTVKETGKIIRKNPNHKIIVILTSNSEKNLPEAFLRRCVFFHIPFPDKNKLVEIAEQHLGEKSIYANEEFIKYFIGLRDAIAKKQPSTAEMIAWLRILEIENFVKKDSKIDFKNLTEKQKSILKISYSILTKTKDDFLTINQ